MALAPWRQSARYALPGGTAQNVITGLKDAINAEVAANPTTALWQVSEFTTAANTASLTIKPTANAASGVGARRVYFQSNTVTGPSAGFAGGQTGWGGGSNIVLFGVSPNGNTDGPITLPNVGAPWPDWIPGGYGYSAVAGGSHINYFETDQGIIIVNQNALMSAVNGNITTMMCGQLAVSIDGATLYDVAISSGGGWGDRPEGATINQGLGINGGPIPTHTPSQLNTSNTMAKIYDPVDGTVAVCAAILSSPTAVPAVNLFTKGRIGRNNERYFFPVPLRQVIVAKTKYKLRQMAYGTTGTYGEVVSDVGGVKARMLSARGSIEDQGIWLTEFQA